jgi:hypothetical protein
MNGVTLQRKPQAPSGGLAFHNLRFGQMTNFHIEIVEPGSFLCNLNLFPNLLSYWGHNRK